MLDEAEQELKRQYLTRGYYAAEVTTTVTPIDRDRVALLFSVVEGPSAKIRQVNFIGNKAFSDSTLRDEMQQSTPNWFSWYTKNDLYSKDKLTGDLENVRSYYLNRGYLEFNIDSTQVSISPDKKDMYLTLTLHEGEPYTISGIQLAGNLLDREAELAQARQDQDRAIAFSADKLQATTKALVDKLGEYGYAFATVNAQPQIDQAAPHGRPDAASGSRAAASTCAASTLPAIPARVTKWCAAKCASSKARGSTRTASRCRKTA